MIIGEGSFGRVYKGINDNTGELIAIKEFCLLDGSEQDVATFRREIEMMETFEHKNIVRYFGTDRTDKNLFILLEFVSGGSIEQMLKQFGAFSEDMLKRYAHHILNGVSYLHEKGIIHRDIKGANVLVTGEGIAKLADFGCSKKLSGMFTASMEESLRAIKGSVQWMAPEVIKQSGSGRSADIWSIGATIIEMANALPPWSEFSNNLATLFHVATSSEPPPFPATLSNHGKEILSKCLVIDPLNRSSAKELLNMRWFESIEFI
jgi:mitogen-activated protein kinase kinase kinase